MIIEEPEVPFEIACNAVEFYRQIISFKKWNRR